MATEPLQFPDSGGDWIYFTAAAVVAALIGGAIFYGLERWNPLHWTL